MDEGIFANALARLSRLGSLPSDSDEEQLRKATLTLYMLLLNAAAITWGAMYIVLGYGLAAIWPLAYSGLSLLSIVHFWRTKRFDIFRFTQLLLLLLLPNALQWSLGGFMRSGAVGIWSLMAPLGALMFQGPRAAMGWLLAYIAMLSGSGLLETRVPAELPLIVPHAVALFFVMNIGGASLIIFLLMRYFVGGQEAAQQRSEGLLLNVLPKAIADRLKRNPSVIADSYADVTVLFADIAGFTPFSAGIPAERLVDMLNRVFSEFDVLAERHQLEKIKTIGDAYMVVGGLPVVRPNHVEAVAELALEMQTAMESTCTAIGIRLLPLRIGIHTGPVVAGVIGRRKFIYDLWGDTVNTAGRMESHGLPGSIQVTETVYHRLQDKFVFKERGVIEVKGKGTMLTYLLLGKRESPVRPTSQALA
jgi:class 3 adenylate cyclase